MGLDQALALSTKLPALPAVPLFQPSLQKETGLFGYNYS